MTIDERTLAHRAQAAIALRRRRWQTAESELRAYLILEPNDAIAWNNLGVVLERQHRSREAVEAYARAASLEPGQSSAGPNLVNQMQRYLGFPAALLLFKVIDIGIHFLRLPSTVQTLLLVGAFGLLAVGAFAFYVRERDELPPETWYAYQSQMARTRRIRYGGLAFVFGGFVALAIVLFVLLAGPERADDSTVVLVVVAAFCWLIVAQLAWRRIVRPFLEERA